MLNAERYLAAQARRQARTVDGSCPVPLKQQASATLIFGSNPVFGLIVPTILVLLSTYRLFKVLKPDSPSEKQTGEAGNEMQVKECTQRLVEGALAASGVQLAAI